MQGQPLVRGSCSQPPPMRGLYTDTIAHTLPHIVMWSHMKQKHAMTKSYTIMTSPPVKTCCKTRHSSKDVYLYTWLKHPPDATVMRVASSDHPNGGSVASSLLSASYTQTLTPHMSSPASGLTGEGGVKLEQSAHIGSLSCLSTLSLIPWHCTSHVPIHPALCQTQSHVDAQPHPHPCTHAGGRQGIGLSWNSVCVGGIAKSPPQGFVHLPGLASPLPHSLPSLAPKGGWGQPPPAGSFGPSPRLKKEGLGSWSLTPDCGGRLGPGKSWVGRGCVAWLLVSLNPLLALS